MVFSLLLSDIFFVVSHLCDRISSTFSFLLEFMAKTKNPSITDKRFECVFIPVLSDFTPGQMKMKCCCTR